MRPEAEPVFLRDSAAASGWRRLNLKRHDLDVYGAIAGARPALQPLATATETVPPPAIVLSRLRNACHALGMAAAARLFSTVQELRHDLGPSLSRLRAAAARRMTEASHRLDH